MQIACPGKIGSTEIPSPPQIFLLIRKKEYVQNAARVILTPVYDWFYVDYPKDYQPPREVSVQKEDKW